MKMATTSQYLTHLFKDNGLVEIRHNVSPGQWNSYWFDNLEDLLAVLPSLMQKGNLYTSLHAPKLRHVKNGRQQEPLTNKDVAFYTRLAFDFDPIRFGVDGSMPSSDDELSNAYQEMIQLQRYLRALEWLTPAYGMSGNGYHLQYRLRTPVTSESTEKMRAIYVGLHSEFNTDKVIFDRSVRSPNQIFRLYGTVNRKSVETPCRPFRKSSIFIPDEWRQVSLKQVDRLAEYFARQNVRQPKQTRSLSQPVSGSGNYSTLDVVRWFQSHGLYIRHLQDNIHDVICPWEDEHSSSSPGDTIIFESDGGWPGFHCNHAHCVDRKINDVMSLFGDADAYCVNNWSREGKQ